MPLSTELGRLPSGGPMSRLSGASPCAVNRPLTCDDAPEPQVSGGAADHAAVVPVEHRASIDDGAAADRVVVRTGRADRTRRPAGRSTRPRPGRPASARPARRARPRRRTSRACRGPARRRRPRGRPASRRGCARRRRRGPTAGSPACGAAPPRGPPPQGSSGVTGLSEPNASGTPAAARAASGFDARVRSRPSRASYSPPAPPHRASKTGWTLATRPREAMAVTCSGSGISTCSIRCRAARRASSPTCSAAAAQPSRTEASAASPMAWKPACSPARVQAATCCGDLRRRRGRRSRWCRRRRSGGPGRRCGCPASRRRTGRRRRRGRRGRGRARSRRPARARPSSRGRPDRPRRGPARAARRSRPRRRCRARRTRAGSRCRGRRRGRGRPAGPRGAGRCPGPAKAARRTAECASSLTSPSPAQPSSPRASGAAASSALEATALWQSVRAR